jgi:hypothetical protein
MQKTSAFQVDSRSIGDIVRKAVNEDHMTLSSIASGTGLSVPTIARLYKNDTTQVQVRTARVVASALGYRFESKGSGMPRIVKERAEDRRTGLTPEQRQRVLKAVMRAVERELEQF